VADTGLDFTHAELASKVVQVIDLTVLEGDEPICKTLFGHSDDDLAAQFGGPSTTDWNGHGSWIGGNIAAALNGTGTNGIARKVRLVALKNSQWCGFSSTRPTPSRRRPARRALTTTPTPPPASRPATPTSRSGSASADDLTNAWQTFSTTSNWATEIPCFTFTEGSGFPQGQCYSTIQGTSMAAPHATAAVALIASAHPSLRHRLLPPRRGADLQPQRLRGRPGVCGQPLMPDRPGPVLSRPRPGCGGPARPC